MTRAGPGFPDIFCCLWPKS